MLTKYYKTDEPEITYESRIPENTTLEERNRIFNSLSESDQRREIALDIIKMIDSEIIAYKQSITCYWPPHLSNLRRICRSSKELQHRLVTLAEHSECQVCARGAVMLARIRLGNGVDPSDPNIDSDDVTAGTEATVKGFDMETMKVMEDCYEQYIRGGLEDTRNFFQKLIGKPISEQLLKNHYIVEVSRQYPYRSALLIKNMMVNVLVHGDFNVADTTMYVHPN